MSNQDTRTVAEQEYLEDAVAYLEDDGVIDQKERRLLDRTRQKLGLSEEQAKRLEEEARKLIENSMQGELTPEEAEYLDDVRVYLEDDGVIDEKERRLLERVRQKLGISEERAKELEEKLLASYEGSANTDKEAVQIKKMDDYYNAAYEADIDKVMAKAQNGDPEAIVVASIMYLYGWNVEKNENLAFDMLFGLTKNTQFPPALVLLGNICENNDEPEKALKCYRSAADQNYADGLMNLGRCYWYGIGCNVDGLKGVQLLEKSLGMGADDANYWLGMVYYFGGNEIKANGALAFKYFSAACEYGIAYAMKYLGHCYYLGFGTNENKDKAREYYLEAVKRGIKDAVIAYAFVDCASMKIWGREGIENAMFENAHKNYIHDSQIKQDDILALYDDTIIAASGKKGFVITNKFELFSSKSPGEKYNIRNLSYNDISRLVPWEAKEPLKIVRNRIIENK